MAKNFVPVIEPSIVCDALMPCQRSAATKVMVSWRSLMRPLPTPRWCGCMAVAPAASGAWAMCRRASRAGSNMPCSRIQRRRARATSARSCSAARRAFFERDLVALKEATPRCDCQISCAGASHKLPRPASGQVAHRSAPVKTPHVPPTARCSRRAAWRCNGPSRESTLPRLPPCWRYTHVKFFLRQSLPHVLPSAATSSARQVASFTSRNQSLKRTHFARRAAEKTTADAAVADLGFPGRAQSELHLPAWDRLSAGKLCGTSRCWPRYVTRPRVSGMPANTRRLAGVPA